MRRSGAIALLASIALACGAPTISATPSAASSGPPRLSSIVAVSDTITVTFNRPMLQIGEGSGVEMSGNYQLDARPLPAATRISCQTRECLVVAIELPAGTLVAGTPHALRVANVVAQSGPAIQPDPTTVTFTVTSRP